MSQDMVSRSLSETLKLYSASQISGDLCYKDYDPGSLGTMTQLDLGCVLKFFLNKFPCRALVLMVLRPYLEQQASPHHVAASSYYM